MLSLPALKEQIDLIIEEYGADTTRSCYYTTDSVQGEQHKPTEPHCIAGVLLHREGVSLDTLSENEGQSADRLAYQFLDMGTVPAAYLANLQRWQDAGHPWGQAKDLTDAGILRYDVSVRPWWDTPEIWAEQPEENARLQAENQSKMDDLRRSFNNGGF